MIITARHQKAKFNDHQLPSTSQDDQDADATPLTADHDDGSPTILLSEHQLALIAVYDTVRQKPLCFVANEEDEEQFIHSFLAFLDEFQQINAEKKRKRAQPILEQIEAMKETFWRTNYHHGVRKIERVEKLIEKRINRVMCLGWNSSYIGCQHQKYTAVF